MTDENQPREDSGANDMSRYAADEGGAPKAAASAPVSRDSSICAMCGEATVDRSENEDSVLCADCRERAIRRKIPVWIWIFLAAVAALAVVAFTRFPAVMKDYKIYKEADARLENGGIVSVYDDLFAMTERYPDSKKLTIKLLEMCCDYGYFDVAAGLYNEYFANTTSNEGDYKRINDCYLRINKYYETANAFAEITDEVYGAAGDLTDPDEIARCAAEVKAKLGELVGDPYQDRALLWLYMSYVSADADEAADCYRKSIEAEPIYIDAFTNLATYMRRHGDLDGAREYYEKAKKLEINDAGAARGLAVLSLLDGELEAGLEQARAVYELYPEEAYALDTYAVALIANGRAAEADGITETATAAGYVLDGEFYAYRNGELSLRDYYVEKEA